MVERATVGRDFEQARCKGDIRFIQQYLPKKDTQELLEICWSCPIRMTVCFPWAVTATLPVGFVVAGGVRWRSWITCWRCGRKVRGLPACLDHRPELVRLIKAEDPATLAMINSWAATDSAPDAEDQDQ